MSDQGDTLQGRRNFKYLCHRSSNFIHISDEGDDYKGRRLPKRVILAKAPKIKWSPQMEIKLATCQGKNP